MKSCFIVICSSQSEPRCYSVPANHCWCFHLVQPISVGRGLLKGSVSRILRWVLLYINRKLSLRFLFTSHKILSLLQDQFTIYKKQAGAPLYYLWYGFIQTILKLQENRCFRNIEIRNNPSEWNNITERYLSTIFPVFLLVLWVYTNCANEGISALQYGRKVLFP